MVKLSGLEGYPQMTEPPARLGVIVAVLLLGLVGSAALVWQGTAAVFSATTDSPANSWIAGTVSLADDDGGAALFSVTGLTPGRAGSNCLTIDYTGDVATIVALYAAASTDTASIAQFVNLTIQQGTGGGFGSCAGFTAASTIFSGTLAAFTAAAQDYASGVGSWSPNGAAARVYRIAYTLDAATPSTKQGGVCTVTFRWQSQA